MPTKKDHEAAVAATQKQADLVATLEAQLIDARDLFGKSIRHQDEVYQVAYAKELLEDQQRCEGNEKRHRAEHDRHCEIITQRKQIRVDKGQEAIRPEEVSVITIDGHTHPVVSAHGLMLGTHGFTGGVEPRQGSRYLAGCGLSKDAADDELDHDTFDQNKVADCPSCLTAIAEMDAGKREDLRGSFLSSKEQLAIARLKNKENNKRNSAP